MGSGDWLKNIISLKKAKGGGRSKKLKGSSAPEESQECKEEFCVRKESPYISNVTSVENHVVRATTIENLAATRIQTAYRAYKARKSLRLLRGIKRLQALTQGDSVKKQASTTLSYLHSWSRIQSQIRARRTNMVAEGLLKQKKLENQLKLEEKLHDLEVEWSGGSETMEEVMARIHQREAASLKRERAMAYAFSHQWRANSNPIFGSGNQELGKADWGWSWMDRWIAARPWESRVPIKSSPKKSHSRQASKNSSKVSTPTKKTPTPMKSISPNAKGYPKARKLSYEAAEKTSPHKESSDAQEASIVKEQTPTSIKSLSSNGKASSKAKKLSYEVAGQTERTEEKEASIDKEQMVS